MNRTAPPSASTTPVRLLAAFGWTFRYVPPPGPKAVVIFYPHTSNWDFVFFAGAVQQWGILPSFIGKHSLFHWPLGRFMREMGGMPIDRSKPGGYVRQVIRAVNSADQIALVIAPEGTRGSTGEWRSGFYHIAMGAGMGIVPAWVDHARRVGGMGEVIMPSGDYAADVAKMLVFYRSVMPDCPRWDVLERSLADLTRGSTDA